MKNRNWIGSAAAALMASALASFSGVRAAHAITPVAVLTAAKAAYDAYAKLSGNQLSLEEATQRVLDAIAAAKTDILSQIDQVAAADVQTCARAAVIDLADIRVLTPDNLQSFARETTECAILGQQYIGVLADRGALDQVGFSMNVVGPIALLVRAAAHLSTDTLASDLRDANATLIERLAPYCRAKPLWGDAEPGGPVEVQLSCTAYNGDLGFDIDDVWLRRGDPLPAFNFDFARAVAMRNTSYAIALEVTPSL
jgi:hypothetical protein